MNDWGSTDVGPVRTIPLGDFYLAAQTASSTLVPPVTVINTPVFGWMRLNNTGTRLIMLDNAVAYGTPGIIVGTTTALPEPATLGLFMIGARALQRRRRLNA